MCSTLFFNIFIEINTNSNQIGVNRLDSLFVIIENFHFFIEKLLVTSCHLTSGSSAFKETGL